MNIDLFPLADYWWFYLAFTGFVLLMLALDLGVFHRKAHVVSLREATIWTVVWIALALVFNFLLYRYALWKLPQDPRLAAAAGFSPESAAQQVGLEFLTGYLVEKSLSVDKILIFVLVFSYFAVPRQYQHRVLFFGILGALLFRSTFIAMGTVLIEYKSVVVLLGVFLIVTRAKMRFAPERGLEPEKNPLIRLFRRFVPVSPEYQGQKFFARLH